MRLSFHESANATALHELWKAMAGFFVVMALLYAATLHMEAGWLRDAHGYVLGRDFLNFWMAGTIAWLPDPGQYYAPDHYMALLTPLVGEGYWTHKLSYPPSFFLIAAPFGLLPYALAYALWTGVGVFLFLRAMRLVGAGHALQITALACPAALACFMCGQASLLIAALLLSAWHWLDRRPWLAGILIGLLSVKPQLGLLFPILLLFSGRWRVIVAAAITVLVLAALSAAWFGVETWQMYFARGLGEQASVLHADTQALDMVTSMMPTIFNDLRLIGVPYEAAMVVQGFLSAGVVALLILAQRRHLQDDALRVVFLACSVLATPYLLCYDLLPLSAAILLLLMRVPLPKPALWLAALCLWVPLLDLVLNRLMLPGASLLPLLLAVWLVRYGPLTVSGKSVRPSR